MSDVTTNENEHGSHWYKPDGTPCHVLTGVNGERRGVTVADARRLGLLPSVTTVLGVKARSGLEAWKMERAIDACMRLSRYELESREDFVKRVLEETSRDCFRAARFGTRLHGEAEVLHRTGQLVEWEDSFPYMRAYEAWFRENIVEVLRVEWPVVHEGYGYAGCLDLLAVHRDYGVVVVDLKTQRVRGRPVFYNEWGLQLAAYREALLFNGYADEVRMLSGVIDTGEPDGFSVRLWEEPERYFRAFKACLELWKFERGYEPAEAIV